MAPSNFVTVALPLRRSPRAASSMLNLDLMACFRDLASLPLRGLEPDDFGAFFHMIEKQREMRRGVLCGHWSYMTCLLLMRGGGDVRERILHRVG